MRTHLLTGPGGAGVSSVAAAFATALAETDPALGGASSAVASPAPSVGGRSVTLACIGDDGSMARLLGPEPALTVMDLAHPRPWGELDEVLASTVERFGGDGDVAEEWRHLPGADVVAALVALGEAVAATDVLVVDLGDLRRAGQFLGAATRMCWVLRGMLGLQAVGARLVGPAAAHAVPRWLDALEAAAEVLRAPETLLHVVPGQSPLGAAKVRRAGPALLLSGPSAGLLIDTADDGVPGAGAGAGAAEDSTTCEWAPFTPAAVSRWPVERQGRLRPDADRLAAPLVAALPQVKATPPVIARAADHLTWRVPLPWVSAADVEVTHRGEDLIVTVHGVPQLVVPPAVVRRCTPVRARLDGTYLNVESVLREGAWRRRDA